MERAKNCQPIAPTVHFDMRQTVTVFSPLKGTVRTDSGILAKDLFCSSFLKKDQSSLL
jgi:hypothetical protein